MRDSLIRQQCRGIGRHVVGGLAQLSFKTVERHFGLGKAWCRTVESATLPGTAVAGEAAVDEIETLAVHGIARRSLLGLHCGQSTEAERGRRKRWGGEVVEIFHCESPQRGSVTTSTTAGSPRLTTATARASAPARSIGSTIGPSPYTPMPRANVAKSIFGSVRVVPISARSMPRPCRAAMATRYMYS